jgi:phospholipid/cholesterol/gamma-HCH transport system substrate-binding protein
VKRDNVNYLVVGVFVLAVGVAFLWLLYRLTGSSGPSDRYFVYYNNVAGIKFGTGAFYEGYQIGQVEAITPERTPHGMHYKVELSVTKDWQIPKDSVARIVASGLLSGVSIDIQAGKSTAMLKPGAEIPGQEQANIFAALNDVAADFRDLSKNGIEPVLKNLNNRFGALADEYRDLSASDVRPLVESLRKRVDDPELFDQLKKVIAKVDRSADQLNVMLGKENQRHLTTILTNGEKASSNLNDLVSRIETTRQEMDHVLIELNTMVSSNQENVSKSVKDAASAMQELHRSLQTVSESIDSVMYHLDGTSRNVHEFSRQIRENPGLLLNSSPQQDKVKNNDAEDKK